MQKAKTRSFLGKLLRGSAVLAMAALVLPGTKALKADAATYQLTICGTTVTDENKSDILNNGVFSFDSSTNTLSVKGNLSMNSNRILIDNAISGLKIYTPSDATLTQYSNANTIVSSSTVTFTGPGKLTVENCASGNNYAAIFSPGYNKIYFDDANVEAMSVNGRAIMANATTNTLFFNYSNFYAKSKLGEYAIYNFTDGISLTGCAVDNPADVSFATGYSRDSSGKAVSELTIKRTEYKLTIAGTPVSDTNKSDILGNGVFSYDSSSKTLTVSGNYTTFENKPLISSEISGLTINVTSDSKLTCNGSAVGFVFSNDTEITGTGKLTLKTYWSCITAAAKLTIRDTKMRLVSEIGESGSAIRWKGTSYPDVYIINSTVEAVSPESSSRSVIEVNSLTLEGCALPEGVSCVNGYLRDSDNNNVHSVTIGKTYQLKIDGVTVSDCNADDILGNGVFRYIPQSKTLCICGDYTAVTNSDLVLSFLPELTIDVQNTSVLDCANTENGIGFYLGGDTVITGAGRLTIKNCHIGIYAVTDGSIKLSDLTLYVDSSDWGITGSNYGESLTVSNCDLDITGSKKAAVNDFGGGISLLWCDYSSNYYLTDAAINSTSTGAVAKTFSCSKSSNLMKYDLYVSGVRVTRENQYDILGNGVFSYDPYTNILTVSGDYESRTYVINGFTPDLTINVTSDSVLSSTLCSIFIKCNTVITGSGKLTCRDTDYDDAVIYLYGESATLTIRDAKIEAFGKWPITGSSSTAKLVIDNSDVYAVSAGGKSVITDFGAGVELNGCYFTNEYCYVTNSGDVWYDESVSGEGSYGPATEVQIKPSIALTSSMVTLSKTSFPYTGSAVKVGSYLTVTYNGETLTYGKDFTTSYKTNTAVGYQTAKVIVKGIGKFKGSVTKKYTITPKKQAKPTLSMNGTALHVVWKADSNAEGYQVQYCKNSSFTGDTLHTANYGKTVTSCNLSTYPKLGETWYVRVRAYITNSSGTKYGTWSDAASKKLAEAITSVTLSKTQFAYTGSAVKVGSYLTVKCGDTKLTYGTDYTTSYSANTAVGYQTATVTVKGTGKYSGTFTKKYTIYPKKQSKPTLSMDGTALHVAWKADSSAVGYELEYCQNSSFSSSDASYHSVTYTGKNAVNLSKYPKLGETWYVRVRAFITNNGSTSGTKYGEWSAAASKKLTAAITGVTLSKTEFNYTGSAITVGSYLTVKCGDTKLTYGTDYTTTYTANKNCGVKTAIVTVKGIGKYTGTFTKKFTIVPAKQAKPALTAVSGGFKAEWTADSNAIGYELVYCKNSSFTGDSLHSYVYTTTSATLTKYPATGEKWYVKVRAVISSDGTTSGTLYGTYSAVASVTAG